MTICWDCTLKHIGTAYAYYREACYGYPVHRWLAVGELCCAEGECPSELVGREIREVRLQVMENGVDTGILPVLYKLLMSTILERGSGNGTAATGIQGTSDSDNRP